MSDAAGQVAAFGVAVKDSKESDESSFRESLVIVTPLLYKRIARWIVSWWARRQKTPMLTKLPVLPCRLAAVIGLYDNTGQGAMPP